MPGPEFLDFRDDLPGIAPRSHGQHAAVIGDGGHRLYGILDHVDKDLLQLRSDGSNEGQIRCQMEANSNRMVVQLVLQNPKYPMHRLINIDDFPLPGVFAEEEFGRSQAFGSSVRSG